MRAQTKRTLALVLAILLAAACLAPAVLRATHRGHACAGRDECLLCRAIEQGEVRLRLLWLWLAAFLMAALPLLRPYARCGLRAPRLRVRTLVQGKVRLND